jgi:hypothetical protein
MTILAITHHTGIRIAEVGELLGLLGGVALVLGAVTAFGKRNGLIAGGLCIGLGFLLLIYATHSGGFH